MLDDSAIMAEPAVELLDNYFRLCDYALDPLVANVFTLEAKVLDRYLKMKGPRISPGPS